jgi:dATP pyrophosphohydrolase
MPRAPFQVVAFPVRVIEGVRQYLLFQRRVERFWQPISGGGELGETPLQAVQRESAE